MTRTTILLIAVMCMLMGVPALAQAQRPKEKARPTTGPTTQPTTQPAAEAIKNSIVYVIDRSGSMEIGVDVGSKLKPVLGELNSAVDRMDESWEFHIILFSSSEIELGEKHLVIATPENKKKAREFLSKIAGSGRTDPIPALKRAANVLAKAKGMQHMVLLTDGDFPDNDAVKEFARKHKGVIIDTVLLGNESESIRKTMKQVAELTHGTFTQIEDLSDAKPGFLPPKPTSQPSTGPAAE